MFSIEYGVKRALSEILCFFLLGAVLRVVFVSMKLQYFAEAIYLIPCIASIRGVEKMAYWSTCYLLGYLLVQFIVVSITSDAISMSIILIGVLIVVQRFVKYFAQLIRS